MNIYVSKNFYLFVRFTYPFRRLMAALTRGLIGLRKKKILLIFGLSRSGTTMLGKFLTLN